MFLSYASQDIEAARRICEALRAAGIEVWLDEIRASCGAGMPGMSRSQPNQSPFPGTGGVALQSLGDNLTASVRTASSCALIGHSLSHDGQYASRG